MHLIRPPKTTPPKWVEGMEDDNYHGRSDSVSSSALRKILKSPAQFAAAFNQTAKPEESKALHFGRLVHQVILDGSYFLKTYDVYEPEKMKDRYGHPNSNRYRDAKREWYEERAGKVIVTRDEFEAIEGMLSSVLAHRDAFNLLKHGTPEVSGFYTDEATGISLRIRPDFINQKHNVLVDLKTTRDASSWAFSRSIWQYRYDFQMAMYSAGFEAIEKRPVEHVAFIAVEKTAPFECAVYACDERLLQTGDQSYRAALAKLKKSLVEDHWPQAQERMENITLPTYARESETSMLGEEENDDDDEFAEAREGDAFDGQA